jgi:hypothetical protein
MRHSLIDLYWLFEEAPSLYVRDRKECAGDIKCQKNQPVRFNGSTVRYLLTHLLHGAESFLRS